jgi:hypothetical protein
VCGSRIKLRLPHHVAGAIAALRAALEALVVSVTKDPEFIRQLDPVNQTLLNVIRHVSRPSAAGLNLMISNQRYVTLVVLTHDQLGLRPPHAHRGLRKRFS